jgi:3-oxoacyl-[acyl-carrier protein] reductase
VIRNALVTGASRGIGRAIAERLTADGMRVLTPTRTELDLANDRSVDAFLSKLDVDVDVLINNAGINPLASLDELTDEQLALTLQVDLISPVRLTRAISRGMVERGWGRIVNIASIWSVVSKPRRFAYTVSKTGLVGATRAMAVELGPSGVLVNAVAPGFVATDLTVQNNPPEDLAAIAESLPLRRMAQPSEIAELVAFLASERNSFMTGQVVVADGGYSCL